jgi:hypothetical protein
MHTKKHEVNEKIHCTGWETMSKLSISAAEKCATVCYSEKDLDK